VNLNDVIADTISELAKHLFMLHSAYCAFNKLNYHHCGCICNPLNI